LWSGTAPGSHPFRLVDLGCGTGRLLIPLALRGYWVLGVDLSAAMLAVAREKARAAGAAVHLLRANLTQLDGVREGSFDYAACLFSTLGMVVGAEERRRVLPCGGPPRLSAAQAGGLLHPARPQPLVQRLGLAPLPGAPGWWATCSGRCWDGPGRATG
jgi:SAM-dependent methyltransferase